MKEKIFLKFMNYFTKKSYKKNWQSIQVCYHNLVKFDQPFLIKLVRFLLLHCMIVISQLKLLYAKYK